MHVFNGSARDPVVAVLLLACALLIAIILRQNKTALDKDRAIDRLHEEAKEDSVKFTEAMQGMHAQQIEQLKNYTESISGVKVLLVEIRTLLSVMNTK